MYVVLVYDVSQQENGAKRWLQIMLKRNASSATAELLFHF